MLEDKILVRRFNHGSRDALRGIYERYKDDLLGLAVALLNDVSMAEDVVHDVFVSFGRSAGTFHLTGSLKSYLSTCVANGARDRNRKMSGQDKTLETADEVGLDMDEPAGLAICSEESQRLNRLLSQLPYDQREVIVLHLHHEMKFRRIAAMQGVSINTIQSRYRYGLDKLRSLLNSEVK